MKIGLSLAGGGVKGSYQIGSYLAFKKCHIKFNGIVGTSIGAANGAIMASGNEKKLLQTWKNMDTAKLLNFDDNIVNYAINKKLTLMIIMGAVKTSKSIINYRGSDINNIKELLNYLININK